MKKNITVLRNSTFGGLCMDPGYLAAKGIKERDCVTNLH